MVNLRINETLQIGAVANRTYRGGEIRNVGIRRSLLQESQMTLFLLEDVVILTTIPQLPRSHLLGRRVRP